eukprot:391839-Rhodomonas_salina.1
MRSCVRLPHDARRAEHKFGAGGLEERSIRGEGQSASKVEQRREMLGEGRGELFEEVPPAVDAKDREEELRRRELWRSSRCTISSSLFLNANCSVLLPQAEDEGETEADC